MKLVLPNGTVVLARGRLDLVAPERPREPDYAIYLDGRWRDDPAVSWPHLVVDWPDFGLPADEDALFAAIRDLYARARSGQLVEVACYGGIGRTGTALACLAAAAGLHSRSDAVRWVRVNYHPSAVETAEQEAMVDRFIQAKQSS